MGLEVNHEYAAQARKYGTVVQSSIFNLDLAKDLPWRTNGKLLVLGNPPWVTNSALSAARSINLPTKWNLKHLNGLDALTGASNFDIAEYITIKLAVELADQDPDIALLTKTHVARNVLQYVSDLELPIRGASLRRIDAKAAFGATVDACLFLLSVGEPATDYQAKVYESLSATSPLATVGLVNGNLVADTDKYAAASSLDGSCAMQWRQGVKHDAAGVVELTRREGGWFNKGGGAVSVEPAATYPMLKAAGVFRGHDVGDRAMIITQTRLGEDTGSLAHTAPRLYSYLLDHEAVFRNRRSSIYRERPRFSMFGIGEYTFALYKIAVSGMHKEARFRLIGPYDGRPVVLDDTCYFLPFDSPAEAAVTTAVLNSPPVTQLIESLVFWDSKRPITKRLLQRIDLTAAARANSSWRLAEGASLVLSEIGCGNVGRGDLEAVVEAGMGGGADEPSEGSALSLW